jgi:hypothetical protein
MSSLVIEGTNELSTSAIDGAGLGYVPNIERRSMGRLASWVIVITLIATGVYVAINTRYEYPSSGTERVRRDRWTGDLQVWGCAAYEYRGTESAYFPMTPGGTNKPCTRYDWVTPKRP